MSDSGHYKPRSATIFAHTRAMLDSGVVAMSNWASEVVDLYEARTPALKRCVGFKHGGDPIKDMGANVKKLQRYMDDDTNARLPADLEEAWVMSLRKPYRDACLREMAGRYGFLPTPIPSTDAAPCTDVARVMRECAEAIEAAATGAGKADVLREVDEAVAALLSLRAAHERPSLKVAG